MTIIPKLIYRATAIATEISADLFSEADKHIQKCIWKCQGPRIATTFLKKKYEVGRLILSDFKTYYEVIANEIVWY